MGNSRSRHRPPLPTDNPPEQVAADGSHVVAPPAPHPTPSFPTAAPYPYPPGDPPYAINGRVYGGWQPSPSYYPRQQPPYGGPPPPPYQQQQQQQQQQSAAGWRPGAESTQELKQTATIRNAVNLKKATLRVAALPGRPGQLAISFGFDASSPCAVTVFQGASEDVQRACRLTAAVPPRPAVLYPRGLNQAYPPSPDAETQTVLDLAALPGALAAPAAAGAGEAYPLVIRLETVAAAGAAQGKRLEDLVPGEEQQGWVQSQTTYAHLHREEDGSYSVRVAKQKIWVEGVSYELQEIYGLEGSSAAGACGRAAGGGGADAAESQEEAEERLCVICLVNPRDTTVLPCRHMCMCHDCAQELRKQTSKCPICRNHVESLLHIKVTKTA